MGKWFATIVVWASLALLFLEFVWSPWPHVVAVENNSILGIIIFGITLCILLCSLVETAISANKAWDFNEWMNSKPGPSSWLVIWLQRHSTNALRYKSRVNALIVLINTILTVVLSVVTLNYVTNVNGYQVFGIDASNGFTIIGITLIVFVVGETLPKQLALKFRLQILLGIGFIPSLLANLPPTNWIGIGLTTPFLAIFGPLDD